MLSHEDILSAHCRIKDVVNKTPIFTSSFFDKSTGRKLFFKAETFQKTGSFKARGALNALSCLLQRNEDKVRCSGVVTHSSGNHAQALAFAAQHFNVTCTVVVPNDAPKIKIDAIASYGARIQYCENTMKSREDTCQEIIDATGAFLVHPHNDFDVMAGQGTVALEFLDQCPDLDAILVSVGGGGLLAGVSVYTKYKAPNCKVFAVEPMGKKLQASLEAGHDLEHDHISLIPTVADGIRVKRLGKNNFPIALKHCEKKVFTVKEGDIVDAMRMVFQRMKLVVEPSASICLAAAYSDEFKFLPANIRNVGILFCGGNVDIDALPWMNR